MKLTYLAVAGDAAGAAEELRQHLSRTIHQWLLVAILATITLRSALNALNIDGLRVPDQLIDLIPGVVIVSVLLAIAMAISGSILILAQRSR